MKNEVWKEDLYRYYGKEKLTLKDILFSHTEFRYVYVLRKTTFAPNRLSRIFWHMILLRMSHRTKIQIPYEAQIGGGLFVGHLGRILVNKKAVLGRNVNIATGVTIGEESRGKRMGCPTIGDNCWIGTNAVLVGKINIGNDVMIAPLSFVNFDVPDHSIVIGNPGKIIPKENATEGYICNTLVKTV